MSSPSLLTLSVLNEAIVGLRPKINQARVHLAHKLIKQAKDLKAKKGSEEQLAKNARKADRLVSEVMTLKTLDRDDVAKFALRSKKPLEKILEEAASDVAVRARARMAWHPAVRSAVTAFRTRFPDWEEQLQSLTARLGRAQEKKSPGIKAKKKEKLKRRKAALTKKKSGGDDSGDQISDQKGVLVQTPQEDVVPHSVTEEKTSLSNTAQSDDELPNDVKPSADDEGEDDESEDAEESDEEEEALDDAEAADAQKDRIFKRLGTMEVRSLRLDKESSEGQSSTEGEDDDDEEPSNNSLEEEVTKSKTVHPRSSFFLGGQSDSEEEDETDENDKKDQLDIVDMKDTFSPGQKSDWKRGNASRGRGRGHQGFSRGRGGERGGRFRQQDDPRPFRGPKDKQRPSFSARGNATSKPASSDPRPNLHPSWAAKRKAHQLAPPTGKKIKFDDRDAAEKASVSLHPSWEAKKRQQTYAIAEPKGKKIVFD